MPRLTLDAAEDLARRALQAAGASPRQAGPTAAALVAAERDGQSGHGLSRVAAYADQVASGKVDGRAEPVAEWTADATLRVDAAHGFAYPAIALGLELAAERAARTGVVAVAIHRSHHAGAMGLHVEATARRGLACLAFSNSPAGIAPWGGTKALFGTNPIAFACPRADGPPLVIDLSLSKIARGKVMVAAQRGESIPEDWALDPDGRPTTDPRAALAGTMLPIGDAKGAALVLLVEILAAALTGGKFGFEAGSFFTADGSPPAIGQFFLVLDAARLGGDDWTARLDLLLAAILAQPGTRLPGERRLARRASAELEGAEIDALLLADLERRAAGA